MEDVRKFQFTKRFSDNPCILEKIKEVITDYTLFCLLACMSQIELNKKKFAYFKNSNDREIKTSHFSSLASHKERVINIAALIKWGMVLLLRWLILNMNFLVDLVVKVIFEKQVIAAG